MVRRMVLVPRCLLYIFISLLAGSLGSDLSISSSSALQLQVRSSARGAQENEGACLSIHASADRVGWNWLPSSRVDPVACFASFSTCKIDTPALLRETLASRYLRAASIARIKSVFVGQEETIARVLYLAMLVDLLDQIRPAPSSGNTIDMSSCVLVKVLYKVYLKYQLT